MTQNQGKIPQANTNEGAALNEIPNDRLHSSLAIESLDVETLAFVQKNIEEEYKLDQFPELVEALYSADRKFQYSGCIGLRKLLSCTNDPPNQRAIDWNCVPRFVEFIKSDLPYLQLEAAWCLSNITSGTAEQTQAVVDEGTIPLFCKLISSQYSDISEQAIWALGNISFYSNSRDLILQCGGMTPLANILMNTNNKKIIKTGTWTMSSLCRVRPFPDYELIKEAIQPLCRLFLQEIDEENLSDCTYAMKYLSGRGDESNQPFKNTNLITKLVRLISSKNLSISIPCLSTLGNICLSIEYIDFVLSLGALPKVFKLLNHKSQNVRREACYVVSSIASGTSQQISQIIQNIRYVQKLFDLLLHDSLDVSHQAARVLMFCTSRANHRDILELVSLEILKGYVLVLEQSKYSTIFTFVLESIEHFLDCGEKDYKEDDINPFASQLKSFGFLDVLNQLQTNPDEQVSKYVKYFFEKYFSIEDTSRMSIE